MTGPLDFALEYARTGMHVFPAHVNAGGAKVPLIARWQEIASTDPAQLAEWWGRWPGAIVGVAHRLTGTLALDIDAHRKGSSGWQTLITHRIIGAMTGEDRPDPLTWAYRTASGGAQRIFIRPPDLAPLSGNYAGALGDALDIILGYSMLPTGDATPGRQWVNHPAEVMPAPAPAWIADAARKRRDASAAVASLPVDVRPTPIPATIADAQSLRYVSAAIDGEAAAIRVLPEGQRQTGLHRAACNVGRALGRQSRWDLAGWAAETLATSTPWCQTRRERATIDRGIAWGLEHGGERS